jgi:hypothetical protein
MKTPKRPADEKRKPVRITLSNATVAKIQRARRAMQERKRK